LTRHRGAFVATTVRTSDVETVRALGTDEGIDSVMKKHAERLSDYEVVLDSLRPTLHRTFPFDRPLDAMAYVEGRRTKGKIVVVLPTRAPRFVSETQERTRFERYARP
jgi:Zinc-binding dehydrogenase